MWTFIKKCINEYNICHAELRAAGIIYVPTYWGIMYYITPERQEQDDKSRTIPKDN